MGRYSETLIGNWEDDPYNGLRTSLENTYQTNWKQLENDFNILKDKIARNDRLAQLDYSNDLVNTQSGSFDRGQQYYENVANRGLASSGVVSNLEKANAEARGIEVGMALGDLLASSEANIQGLSDGNKRLLAGQRNLNNQIGSDLGNITSKEFAEKEQYANTMSQISEREREKELAKQEQDFYRRLGIMETLNNTELDDYEKRKILINDYDLVLDDANSSMETMNYLFAKDKYDDLEDAWFYRDMRRNNAKKKMDKYTYTDLWNLLHK